MRKSIKGKGGKVVDPEEAAKKRLREIVGEVSGTAAGIDFFKYFMEECGFHRPSTVMANSGDISDKATLYNEARRSLYLRIREYIPRKARIKIEIDS